MAKLNVVIKAFDSAEIEMLYNMIEREEKSANAAGIILPELFQDLRQTINRARQYVGFNKDHPVR